MRNLDAFLTRAARHAKRRGLALEFRPSDLGDLFHVRGRRATVTQFVALLVARGRVIRRTRQPVPSA